MNDVIDVKEFGPSLLDSSPADTINPRFQYDQTVALSLSGSVWRQENIFGSFAEDKALGRKLKANEAVPDFDYFDNVPEDMQSYRDQFVASKSLEDVSDIADKIRKEINDRENMANHPTSSFALGILANIVDPTILLPGGAIYKSAKSGYSALRSAASIGLASAASQAVQEAALVPTQKLRTVEESLFNVLAAATVGAVMGGVGGAVMGGPIGRTARAEVVDTLANGYGAPKSQDLSAAKVDPDYLRQSDQMAGMAKFVGKLGENLTPMNRLMGSEFESARNFANLIYDHNIVLNKHLPESGNEAAPVNVERLMKLQYGKIEKAFSDYQDIFYQQAGIERGPFKAVRGIASRQGLGFDEFDAQVGKALRRGDESANPAVQQAAELLRKKVFDPLKDEAINLGLLPENVTQQTAISYLTRVYNRQAIKENVPAFKSAIRPYFVSKNEELKAFQPTLKALNTQVTTAKRAVTVAKINQAEMKRLERLSKRTEAENKKLASLRRRETLETAEANLKNQQKSLEDAVPFDLRDTDGNIRKIIDDEAHLEAIIDNTISNILGRNDSHLRNPLLRMFSGGKSKPLHNRSFLIPDEMIEDWLINSASKVSSLYSKAMIPTIELNKFARRNVSPGRVQSKLQDLQIKKEQLEVRLSKASTEEKPSIIRELAEINEREASLETPNLNELTTQFLEDLTNDLEIAKQGKSAKESAKIEKQYEKNKSDMIASLELMQGIYGRGPNTMDNAGATIAKNIKTYNFVRLLGFMTITSISDVGYHVMKHGPLSFMREGMSPILRRMSGMKVNNENLSLLKDLGKTIETVRGQRLKSMLDHEGTALEEGAFTRGLDLAGSTFGNATLMNQWNDMMQEIAGSMSISRTLRAIDRWANTGKMSRQERIRLNNLGIDESSYRTIYREFKKTGGVEGGSYYTNHGDWNVNDPDVAKAWEQFSGSIVSEIDFTAIVPGMGDKPLASHTLVGQLMLQFKSFLFASTNRVLLAGLSRNDANFYMGTVATLFMGALSYTISSKVRRPDEEVDLSWGKLSQEAIDRSGILGVYMEGFNLANKAVGGTGSTRYHSRGIWGALAGPTGGAVEDILFLMNKSGNVAFGDDYEALDTKDAEKVRRLMPYQNLFYLYNLNRLVTKKVALGLGFEESD